MTDFYSKKDITIKVIKLVNEKLNSELAIEYGLKNWWTNIRNNGGLRLTDSGYTAFTLVNLECWSFPYSKLINSNFLLFLDKHLKTPYYIKTPYNIKNNNIIVFDSRIASTIILYSSFENYIDKLKKINT